MSAAVLTDVERQQVQAEDIDQPNQVVQVTRGGGWGLVVPQVVLALAGEERADLRLVQLAASRVLTGQVDGVRRTELHRRSLSSARAH